MSKNKEIIQTARYTNETFSGCDMVATVNMKVNIDGKITRITKVLGEIQTISYSINMAKSPIYSIGNVNAKDYVLGRRTIAGSLVFSVFNYHFAKHLLEDVNDAVGSTNLLVDELPPFDITISMANEYGYRSRLVIYGIRLLNEGQVMSINDVYTENTFQFFATDLEYLNDEAKFKYNGKDKYGRTKLYTISTTKTEKMSDLTITNKDGIYKSWNNKYLPKFGDKEILSKDYIEYQEMMKKPPVIDAIVKQPTKPNKKGIAIITISKLIKGNKHFIKIKNGEKNSKYEISSLRFSTELQGGKHIIHLESVGSETIKSNEIVVSINAIKKEDALNRYSPAIEKIGSSSIIVTINDAMHTHVTITNETFSKTYESFKKKCIIDGLSPDTKYFIFSHGKDELQSNKVNFKTLKTTDAMFNDFSKFIFSNSSKLAFQDMHKYQELLNEAQKICNDKISTSLISLKKSLTKKLTLITDSVNKSQLKLKIKMCSELISLSLKFETNSVKAINKECVEMPIKFYNSNKELYVRVNDSVDRVEIYRLHNNIYKFVESVGKMKFETIEGIANSIMIKEKAGEVYRIYAFIGSSISAPLDIIKHSQDEIVAIVNNPSNSINLSKIKDAEKAIVNKFSHLLPFSLVERLILSDMTSKEGTTIIAPTIINSENSLSVKHNIYKYQSSLEDRVYRICFANKEDILTNSPIYKKEFLSSEAEIFIDIQDAGICKDIYSVWIESVDEIQISDPATFEYMSLEEESILKYENKYIFEAISKMSKDILPSSVSDEIEGVILYNSNLSYYNLIENVISVVMSSNLNTSTYLKFLSSLSPFIGPICKSSDILHELNVSDNNLIFNSNIDGTLVIIDLNKNAIDVKNHKIKKGENTVKINIDNAIIFATNTELSQKSKIMHINRKLNLMEVL